VRRWKEKVTVSWRLARFFFILYNKKKMPNQVAQKTPNRGEE
jgi:hypothetical protein